jgi:hypothetical protein
MQWSHGSFFLPVFEQQNTSLHGADDGRAYLAEELHECQHATRSRKQLTEPAWGHAIWASLWTPGVRIQPSAVAGEGPALYGVFAGTPGASLAVYRHAPLSGSLFFESLSDDASAGTSSADNASPGLEGGSAVISAMSFFVNCSRLASLEERLERLTRSFNVRPAGVLLGRVVLAVALLDSGMRARPSNTGRAAAPDPDGTGALAAPSLPADASWPMSGELAIERADDS